MLPDRSEKSCRPPDNLEVILSVGAFACLRQLPLLRDLPDADIQAIVSRSRVLGFTPGQVLFREGEPANAVFLLKSGQVQLSVLSESGRELLLGIVGAGELIGQEGLFTGQLYRCTARTVGGACCLALTEEDIREVLAATPDLSLRLVSALSRQLTEAQTRMADLALYDAKARCLKTLQALAVRHGRQAGDYLEIPLRLTHADVARLIRVSRTTATEILGQLRAEGQLRMEGGHMFVRRPKEEVS